MTVYLIKIMSSNVFCLHIGRFIIVVAVAHSELAFYTHPGDWQNVGFLFGYFGKVVDSVLLVLTIALFINDLHESVNSEIILLQMAVVCIVPH